MPICRLINPVGAGLPAMAVCQLFHPAMTLRHREASSLLQMPPKPCGSWLASDGGESVISSGNDIAPSRDKLAPTDAAPPCGSWLASDGGVSVITSDKDIAPSRGKLAPTDAAYTLWELACQRWRCVSHFIRRGHCTIARQARSYRCSSTLWELACQRWRCVSYFIRQGHCAIARQARSYTCQEQSLRLAHTPCLNVMIPGFLA